MTEAELVQRNPPDPFKRQEQNFQDNLNLQSSEPNPLDRLVQETMDEIHALELKGQISENQVITFSNLLMYGKRYRCQFAVDMVYQRLKLSVSKQGRGRDDLINVAKAAAEAAKAQAQADTVRL